MKKCTICKKEKELSEFNKHPKRKDGLQSHCRECNRQRSRAYYKRNPEKHKKAVYERKIKHTKECQEWIYSYFLTHFCVDCGESNPIVLEFDHIRDKEFTICEALRRNLSLGRIKKEVDKCEVRCVKCHRIKTAKDFNWWIYKMYMGS